MLERRRAGAAVTEEEIWLVEQDLERCIQELASVVTRV